MSLAGLVGRARVAAERLMQDTCTIGRPSTADPVMDPVTFALTPPAPTELYAGKCRVKPVNNADRVVPAGEQPISLWPFQVSVPMSVLDLAVDDVVTITASALDPDLVGLKLRVREVTQGSQVSARRLGCEVNAG